MAVLSAELHSELALAAVGLETTSSLLAERADGDFIAFTIKNEHPHESRSYPSLLKDSLTVYGQQAHTAKGGFHAYGDIRGTILEPTPSGILYQDSKSSPLRPYIIRGLFRVGELITVDTATILVPQTDEPVVYGDGNPYGPRFHRTTTYNRETGDVTLRRGEYTDYKNNARDDRTFEQDIAELPDEVVALRLATLIRTVRAASSIFWEATLDNLKFIPTKGEEDFV